MAGRVEWENAERTILHFVFGSEWTWEELNAARAQAHELLEQTTQDLGIILQFPSTVFPPSGILEYLREQQWTNPRIKVVVIVATSSVVLTLFEVFAKLYWSIAR